MQGSDDRRGLDYLTVDRLPRSQCVLSSLQIVDFFLLLPTVGSICVRHLSAVTGRRLDPSFFVRITWRCPIGVVLIPFWHPSREFNWWIRFSQISNSIVPIRCFTVSFSLDARTCRRSPVVPSCLHSRHRIGTLTRQRIWRCTGDAFLSRDGTQSVLRPRLLARPCKWFVTPARV